MTEKKVCDLTVDPEFRDLIPPLNEEELKLLEESLVADGCESPLIVWNGVIIDGHNRYMICQKHDIPFSTSGEAFRYSRGGHALDAAQPAGAKKFEQLSAQQSCTET